MICNNCGNSVSNRDIYCPYCGTLLKKNRNNRSTIIGIIIGTMLITAVIIGVTYSIVNKRTSREDSIVSQSVASSNTDQDVIMEEKSTQDKATDDLTEHKIKEEAEQEESIDIDDEYRKYVAELTKNGESVTDGIRVETENGFKCYRFYAIEDFDSDGDDELFLCSELEGMIDFVFYTYDTESNKVVPTNGLKNVRDWVDFYGVLPLHFYKNGNAAYIEFFFSLNPNFFDDAGIGQYLNDDNSNLYCGFGYDGDNDIGIDMYIIRDDVPELIENIPAAEFDNNIEKLYTNEELDVELCYLSNNNETSNDDEYYSDYSSLIEAYKSVLLDVSKDDCSSVESFFDKYNINGDGFYSGSLFDYGYTYKDINGDGQEELIVSDGYTITSVFTLKDGSIINLINGWSRNSLSLCSDNSFYCLGTGGVSISYFSRYIINETGDDMILTDEYKFDASNYDFDGYEGNAYEDDIFWYYSTIEDNFPEESNTTYEQAQAFINEKSESIIQLEYTPFYTE